MLEVREFTIFMDHKPLTHALFRVSPPWSITQQCHLSYLVEFTSSVVHVPGPENVVADALSRPSPVLSFSTPSQLSLTPSSDKPVIFGFDVSLLPLLQLTCPSVS